MIDKGTLEKLIPHGPAMCLLDGVTQWSDREITCTSSSHRRADNPLLDGGALQTIALVEYGAQAAAVHAGLIQSSLGRGGVEAASQPAYLAAVKDIELFADCVDTDMELLCIHAQVMLNNSTGAVYGFTVMGKDKKLIQGRLTVILAH